MLFKTIYFRLLGNPFSTYSFNLFLIFLGSVFVQPVAQAHGTTVVATSSHNQQNHYQQQHQPYPGGPAYSQQQQPYPQQPPQHHNSQAPMHQGGVTYGGDYNQQPPPQVPREEQTVQPDAGAQAPPPYSQQ